MNINQLIESGFPIVAVNTSEDRRLIATLVQAFEGNVFKTSIATPGLYNCEDGNPQNPQATLQDAINYAAGNELTVLVIQDFQHIANNPGGYRALIDAVPALKQRGSTIVLAAPSWSLPDELKHEAPVIDFALPTREQLSISLESVVSAYDDKTVIENQEAILDAAAGLTIEEAENAIALAAGDKGIDAQVVTDAKMETVRAGGLLEVQRPVDPSTVGGLHHLKGWVEDEVIPNKHDEQLRVRGALFIGSPGTGKSLSAKAISGSLGWPLVKMDVGTLKGSLVGQSEANMRNALKQVEAIAPCVLFLDEIEKAVGGYKGSAQSDGGTTLGMLGQLLNWLQEHDKPIFTVATSNDYAALPPELTRAGRFDERWFVDLPNSEDRAEIARIHLERFGCGGDEELPGQIASVTSEWSGAEIEALVKSAARLTQRNIDASSMEACAEKIKPVSQTAADSIKELRAWADANVRRANAGESSLNAKKPKRKISKLN